MAELERVVGRVVGEAPGPTLVIVGGVHGNEPAGVHAAERVLARLDGVRLRGEFVALCGNLRALRLGRRYQVRDLNRQWSGPEASEGGPGRLRRAGGEAERSPLDDDAEALEKIELRAELDAAIARARGTVYFIDLHTTSAEGIPFVMVGDTLAHRAFARAFPLPVILGLEEQLDGVLTEYMTARGCVTMACEGGQHQSAAAAGNLEAVVWLALVVAGLAPRELPGQAEAWAHLDEARRGLPRLIEVLFRHPVGPDDAFVMEPGFANIAEVGAGRLLARDRAREYHAPGDGLVLLPLYQAQGSDGYFFGRAVGPIADEASVWARRLGLDRLLPFMPGVRPRGAELALDPRAAGRYPMSLFRLFGFRRAVQGADGELILRRR